MPLTGEGSQQCHWENWAFFDQFDAILGTRPSSAPETLLQSGGPPVLLKLQNVDSKLLELCVPPSSCTTLLTFNAADETQVPAGCDDEQDPDLTYVHRMFHI